MRRGTGIALALLAAISLTGCDMFEPPLESGYITSKTFNKHHLEKYSDTSYCAAYDKNGLCTNTVTIPGAWYMEPDRWYFTLKSEDGKRKDNHNVTLEIYEKYTVGMHYPDPR